MNTLHPACESFWHRSPNSFYLQTHAIPPAHLLGSRVLSPFEDADAFERAHTAKYDILEPGAARPDARLTFYRHETYDSSLSLHAIINQIDVPWAKNEEPLRKRPRTESAPSATELFVHALGCLETRTRVLRVERAPVRLPTGHDSTWDALRLANTQLAIARKHQFRVACGGHVEPTESAAVYAIDAIALIDTTLREGLTSAAWLAIAARALAVLGRGEESRAASRLLLLASAWPGLYPPLLATTPTCVLPRPDAHDANATVRARTAWQTRALAVAIDAAGHSAAAGNPQAALAFEDAVRFGRYFEIKDDGALGADAWRQALLYLPPAAERTAALLALRPSAPNEVFGARDYVGDPHQPAGGRGSGRVERGTAGASR